MDAAEHDDKRRREDPSRTMKAAPAGTRTSSRRGTRAFLVVLFALTVVWYLVSSRGSLRFASKNGRSQTAQQQDSAPASLPEADLNSSKTSTDLSTATTSMHPTRTLLPLMFTPLPLGSINPTGWLLNELQTSAQGLAGHLHDFYPYVKDSPWIGGESEYSGLHEAFPYWFNGLVYLSHSLPDEDQDAGRLRDQVREAADEVLRRQADDGWLGPEVGEERLLWGRWPLLLGFVGLVEANPRTWEGKLVPATQQFVKLAHNMLKDGGKGYLPQNPGVSQGDSTDWGRVRAADYMIVLQWLLEEYPGEMDDVLYDSMRILYDGMLKWEAWYNGATYVKEDLNDFPENVTDAYFPWLHGVNVGQGLKAPAVIQRFTHNSSLVQTAHDATNWTFRYHGAVSGTVLADERMDGLAPYAGSELCTAVETMYSLSYLYQALGANSFADMNELAAFNALPTMLAGDHWAHQYMAEPNQPYAKELAATPFYNSHELAQTFGLEPNYPCCTVNFPQGWPKFIANSWVKVGKAGLAHVLLSSSTVQMDGIKATCETKYPFGKVVVYKVETTSSKDFYIRVPQWELNAAGSIDHGSGIAGELRPDPHTGLHKIQLAPGNTTIVMTLSARTRIEPRANDTVAVYNGPLLYALEIGSSSKWQSPRHFDTREPFDVGTVPYEARDWTTTNTTAWNIAIDPSTLLLFGDRSRADLPTQIFAPGSPPVYMTATGCEIEWPLFLEAVPGPPVAKEKRRCLSKPHEVRLVPYGSAKLHMAELPVINLSSYDQHRAS